MSPRFDHIGGFQKLVRLLLEGFEREFPASAEQVVFGGKKMTLAQVHKSLAAIVEGLSAVDLAHRALRQAVSDRRRSMKGYRSTFLDAVLFLKHHLGKDSPRLVLFGVRPPKPRSPLSVEARVIAQAKAAATRKARKTMGRRQRLSIGRPEEPTVQVVDPAGKPISGAGSVAIDGQPHSTK